MSEQVPEIQEAIDRQRERSASSRSIEVERDGSARSRALSGDRWLWMLVVAAVVGLGVLAVGQTWYFQRPRPSMLSSALFSVTYLLLGAVLVAGVVGVVVSIQLRGHERRTSRAARNDVLARLHAEGAIDDATLARLVRETVGPPDGTAADRQPRTDQDTGR